MTRMFNTIIVTALALWVSFGAGAAIAAEANPAADEVFQAVTHFAEAINADDHTAIKAAFAPQASILDDFPPYAWQGADAVARWIADFAAAAKTDDLTGLSLKLKRGKHIAVTGDHAYAPIPALFSFKTKGKKKHHSGTQILAFDKINGEWKITALAWTPKP